MPSSRGRALDFRRRPPLENHVTDAIGQVHQLADRRPALEARCRRTRCSPRPRRTRASSRARSDPSPTRPAAPRVTVTGLLAVLADPPHQPLRQHAVERRDELVGLDAHVQEPAEHVDDVVGVDGREHQVAGERRLNRDLRGFRVADFADHDLVGVVAQDRPQAARERQPLLLVDRNLRDARELVFDRVFNRDDLVLDRLDLGQRRVERRRLAAAGRAR